MIRPAVGRAELRELYLVESLSMEEVGRRLGVSRSCVARAIRAAGIPTRSPGRRGPTGPTARGRTLAVARPEVVPEWHPTRNGKLRPETVASASPYLAWWRCPAGHEWRATVHSRTRGRGCPSCSGKRASPQRNLAVCFPEVAREWHPTRNGMLSPEEVTPRSRSRRWWRCPRGHEWETMVVLRTAKGTGCPACAGKRPTEERNLAVCFPEVAREWHPTRNGGLTPADVAPMSSQRRWWRCPQGHEWATTVGHRTRRGTGCPRCAERGRKGIPLAEFAPELLAEWCDALNGRTGDQVAAKSTISVWWRCRVDSSHLWRTRLVYRTKDHTGCPYCAGNLPTPQHNLAACFPDLVAQWHASRNGGLSPTDLSPRTKRRLWWRCPEGHEWEAAAEQRTRGSGCPACSGKRPSPERNLAVCFPEVAREWHPTRNGDLLPAAVLPYSSRRVWWRCPWGHEYAAVVASRVAARTGCPTCVAFDHALDTWMAHRARRTTRRRVRPTADAPA